MPLEKRITIRELLRSFRKYREMLLAGKVFHLVISVGNGEELELSRRKRGLTGAEFARRIRAYGKPLHIKRPHWMWDEWMERIEKRRSKKRS